MADNATTQRRQQGLEQAASVVFALMGIVPLLLFTFTLWQVGAIHRTLVQACLVLTLVLMLLGFWLFRSMLAQLSEGVKEVARIAQAVARPAAGRPMAAPPVMPTPARPVAGLGSIWELGEMARTMDLLWQREARSHVGRHVQITVANSEELTGRLLEATEDGLLLEQAGGGTVAITYLRVQGIEPVVGG